MGAKELPPMLAKRRSPRHPVDALTIGTSILLRRRHLHAARPDTSHYRDGRPPPPDRRHGRPRLAAAIPNRLHGRHPRRHRAKIPTIPFTGGHEASAASHLVERQWRAVGGNALGGGGGVEEGVWPAVA
ncbi:LOW QUALITY PROTEIN: hypothetical protein BRADI_1g32965v3 [Brachypodium distachyon]|uniref:Uncharacterized protein n=1 Tax=Brachypodium distachyon TaxID=15368 RepID=A0A2K2DMG5_BRADI|nr:LOW QUALITY PROTEIN: hypothetical protein BRADI_1g32965v3 [Brachypodium distachyon]